MSFPTSRSPAPLTGTRAAVTGATGFLGGHIAEALAAAGAELSLLARPDSDRSRLALPGIRWVEGTVGQANAMTELARGAKIFIHVAGIVTSSSDAKYRAVNVEGTRLAMRASLEEGVCTFVQLSTLAAGGPARTGAPPRREDDPPSPHGRYGRSKREAELVIEREGGALKKWAILRPGVVYGPHDRGLLPYFKAVRAGWRPVIGRGERTIQPAFAADIAESCLSAITAPGPTGRTYFTVPRRAVTWNEFGEILERIVGRRAVRVRVPEILLQPRLLEKVPRWRGLANRLDMILPERWEADPGRAEAELGWTSRTPLEKGLRITYDWYRARGWL